jgi:hypothetical protein
MKKYFFVFLFTLTGSVFSFAAMPEKGTPVKFGKYLLYFDCNPNKATNSTELVIEVYNAELNKETEHKITVENFAGKYYSPFDQFDKIPGSEWIEISFREKMLSGSGIIIRLNSEFNIVGRYTYDSDAGKHPDADKLSLGTINFIPMEHFAAVCLPQGIKDLDARTADGSLIYLNFDMNNISVPDYNAQANAHPDMSTGSLPTTLCFFQSNEKDYKVKWKLNIKEVHIVGYRVYLFGNDLFLYTSNLISESGPATTQQTLRKIDYNTGQVIYEVKLQAKPDFELMLSNAVYNETSKELIFCGNYMTTLPDKDQKKATTPLSSFFLGKIDVKGICTIKDVELKAEKPAALKSDYLNEPFLCVKELHLNKDGHYTGIGQYNYQLPKWFSYTTVGSTGGMDMQPYKMYVAGLSFIIFGNDLNVSSQETNMINYTSKNSSFTGYYCYMPEVIALGTAGSDTFANVNYTWDPETESGVITCVDLTQQSMGDNTSSLYVLKVSAGKKEYFKLAGELPQTEKKSSVVIVMNTKSLIYYTMNESAKTEFASIDL